VAGFSEYGDEPACSDAMELVNRLQAVLLWEASTNAYFLSVSLPDSLS
jgi:hypothetical protein